MSAGDAYAILAERLDFPGSTRLRLILEDLMTPEQARLAVELPGSPEEVAQKTGIPLDRVKEQLDALFFKGVIFPRGDFRKREYFRFARTVGQFHDSTMATQELDLEKDRPFFEKWYDFKMNEMNPKYPANVEARQRAGRPASRIVPAYKAIKDLAGVLPYENFPEMLKAQSPIAVVPCPCRGCNTSVGKPCTVYNEEERWACFQFGRGAEYAITRGSGKELSPKEAVELSAFIEESGLLHRWENSSSLTGVNVSCQCCRDCCIAYVALDQANRSIGMYWDKSRYEAYVNVDDCTGCQDCVDRCQFDAITMERAQGSKRLKAVVDAEKCYGCGVCVVGCEPEALKMKVARPPEYIPAPAD